MDCSGGVAERLGRGLQSPVLRFESGRRLQRMTRVTSLIVQGLLLASREVRQRWKHLGKLRLVELGVMKIGNNRSIVVMGVSGSGKSTIAGALATRHGVPSIDGDSLHGPHNIVKMSDGQALSDAERTPWLNLVGQRFKEEVSASGGCVVACSALKRKYRDVLREYAPEAFFVMLSG